MLAGTGIPFGGYLPEALRWNDFLNEFGLTLDTSFNTIQRGDIPTKVDSSHPLFKNVNSIYYSYGNGVRDLSPADPSQKIIFKEKETGNGLFGIYANSGNYQYQVKTVDIDNDKLTYALDRSPTGMTIDANTGLITWENNDWDWTEKLDVTVKVTDDRGGSDTQSFTLNLGKQKQADGKIGGTVYIDDGKPREQLVYFNDFEGSNPNLSAWSNSRIDTTPIGNRHFLGQYGGIVESPTNSRTSLSLNNLGSHDSVTVGFDLYLLNSWDGNLQAYYSPDRWKLKVRDGQTLLDTTFMNSYLSNRQALSQSYPDNYFATGTIKNPAFTGATEVETLGYNLYGAYRDSVYHLEYTFDHADPNLILDFIGGTDEVISNESWGIDNVKVSVGLPKKGVSGEQIYLDRNKNGKLDAGETSTLTDLNGKYSFNLPTGDYTIAQVLLPSLTATRPIAGNYNVTVRRDQAIGGLDFVNSIDSGIAQVPPKFLSTPLLSATIDRKYRYQAVAKDDNFDPLTYDLVVKPDGMIIDAKTGVVTWLPTANQLGKTDAVIRVSDENGGVDLQAFSINVTQANLAPGFINEIPGFTFYTTAPEVVKVAAGDTYRFQFKGLDPDSDPISYRIKSFNSQAGNNINTLRVSIDANTGLLTWNTAGQALAHILQQYITTSIGRDQNVRKRAQNNIDENSEHHSPLCPISTLHTDRIDAQSLPNSQFTSSIYNVLGISKGSITRTMYS